MGPETLQVSKQKRLLFLNTLELLFSTKYNFLEFKDSLKHPRFSHTFERVVQRDQRTFSAAALNSGGMLEAEQLVRFIVSFPYLIQR